MENPEEEISGVIRALTQGTRDEQEQALNNYFLPDAYFVHPFCRVPSFQSTQIRMPISGIERTINSRLLVLLIYRWYKIMSPKILLKVDSTGKVLPQIALSKILQSKGEMVVSLRDELLLYS